MTAFDAYWGVGDPQTTHDRFLSVLATRQLVSPRGGLKSGVALLGVGDYFDFPPPAGMSRAEAGLQGVSILHWLAAHPADQVPILMGNHDAARVMELHRMSDATFGEAHRLAEVLDDDAFARRFPDIPTRGIARRDFSGFCAAQRKCVQTLLLSGRMKLAQAVRLLDGRHCLVTHAGVTAWVLEGLGIPHERDPQRIALALNGVLAARVAAVSDDWTADVSRPLDLGPIHHAGVTGEEGGGLLYHRLATTMDGWSTRGPGPRRFGPEAVPRGLLQAVGHTQHKKMAELLPEHAGPANVAPGQLRCAVFGEDDFEYRPGLEAGDADTVMWFFDGGLHFAPPEAIELMPFAQWLP
jgi:hypothetical protein